MSTREVTLPIIFEELCGVSILIWPYEFYDEALRLWRKEMKKLGMKTRTLSPLPYDVAEKMCKRFLKRYLNILKSSLSMRIKCTRDVLDDIKNIPDSQLRESLKKTMEFELQAMDYYHKFK